MLEVIFKTGNIVEELTEGLVCSGNVSLNMSGGVNGELLKRGGENMQREMHAWLNQQEKKYVQPGFVMRIGPEPFPFKTIVYTVAIDGFYDSSVRLVEHALVNAFTLIEEDGCKTVSVPALATGYGHLSKRDFGKALRKCLRKREWRFEQIQIVLRDKQDLEEVKKGYEDSG